MSKEQGKILTEQEVGKYLNKLHDCKWRDCIDCFNMRSIIKESHSALLSKVKELEEANKRLRNETIEECAVKCEQVEATCVFEASCHLNDASNIRALIGKARP